MKKLILIIVLISSCIETFAQMQSNFIQGIIRDRQSKQPIPYASISIMNTTRGAAGGQNGEFYLLLKKEDVQSRIKISSIGFVSRSFSIDSLSAATSIVLELSADVKILDELQVNQSPINPIEIIQLAIDSTTVNYQANPFNLEFYSTMRVTSTLEGKQCSIESIVNGYYMGYATSSEKKFEILAVRLAGENPTQSKDYAFWPTLELHRADLIADPANTGILNKSNLGKFEYQYRGALLYDEDTVYHIQYKAPKPTEKITGYGITPKQYKGNIYITTSHYAIVKHEIETDQFQYSIIYKKVDGKYFPYLVKGERQVQYDGKPIHVINELSLLSIEVKNVKIIDYRTNEFQSLDVLPENPEYWKQHYPKN